MGTVLVAMAALWVGLWWIGAPLRVRWAAVGILWLAIVVATTVLPEDTPQVVALGGSPAPWLILGGAAGVIAGYARILRALKGRVSAETETPVRAGFSQVERGRYAAQLELSEFAGAGQLALKQAKVLIVGVGGANAVAAQSLAAAGVGIIGLLDEAVVESSDLPAEVLFRDADIGMPKVFAAQQALAAQNPFADLRPYHRSPDQAQLRALLQEYDLALWAGSQGEAAHQLAELAQGLGKVLVIGRADGWAGQVSIVEPSADGSRFPDTPEGGSLGPMAGVVGAMMAVETIKILTGAGRPLGGATLIYDAFEGTWRSEYFGQDEEAADGA